MEMSGEEETDRQEDVTARVQAGELIQHRLDAAACREKIHAPPTLKLSGCWGERRSGSPAVP